MAAVGAVGGGMLVLGEPAVRAEAWEGSEQDEPEIQVWFEEGCDRTYRIGDYLHLRYRSNVDGMARVWRYPDEELFTQQWMAANVTYEIDGPVTGPVGQWWILGELLGTEASGTCHYTTTLATPTQTAAVTASVTATATAAATQAPSFTVTPISTSATSSPQPTVQASRTPGATMTQTARVTASPRKPPTETPGATQASASSPTPSVTASATVGHGAAAWLPRVARGRR